MAQLQFHEAGRPLFVFLLRPGRTVIGRADSCDLALPSDSVSRVHCVIEGRADGYWISDRSRHGTAVNGQRVDDSRRLDEGDDLGIGTYRAMFSTREEATLRSA